MYNKGIIYFYSPFYKVSLKKMQSFIENVLPVLISYFLFQNGKFVILFSRFVKKLDTKH